MTRPLTPFSSEEEKRRYECYISIYCGPDNDVTRSERTNMFLRYYPAMTKISVEVPDELLADLDDHVGEDGKFVNRSEAVRASIRKTLDQLDEIDHRQGRIDDE